MQKRRVTKGYRHKLTSRFYRQPRPKVERIIGEPLDTGRGYRPKYACPECRMVRRVPRLPPSRQKGSPQRCGRCGGELIRVNPMFKPPKANTRRGKRLWEKYLEGRKKALMRARGYRAPTRWKVEPHD